MQNHGLGFRGISGFVFCEEQNLHLPTSPKCLPGLDSCYVLGSWPGVFLVVLYRVKAGLLKQTSWVCVPGRFHPLCYKATAYTHKHQEHT